MKAILFFSLMFGQSYSFAGGMEDWPDSYSCVFIGFVPVFSTIIPTCFTIAAPTDTTNGKWSEKSKKALFVEAAPAANNYLVTGQGLNNPALVYAMVLAKESDTDLASAEELALRIIESANRP